jgi:hypothetical protein
MSDISYLKSTTKHNCNQAKKQFVFKSTDLSDNTCYLIYKKVSKREEKERGYSVARQLVIFFILRLGHHIKLDVVLRELCVSFLKTDTLIINYLNRGIITSRSQGSVTIIVGNTTQSRYARAIKKGNNKVALG